MARLLLRFGLPISDEVDASAQATADSFAEKQYFLPGYEVRRAKRFEYQDKRGNTFCKYEVFGEYDVERMAKEVQNRLLEVASQQDPSKTAAES